MSDPSELGVRKAVDRIARGELTATALLESCLERIRDREDTVGAWELIDQAGARARAAALDRGAPSGALHGIPVAVKDIIDVAGLPTRCGSSLRDETPAAQDAWIVRQVRKAGAVVLGKSVTTEFAYFTPGKTRNPHDPSRTPGGSSSGSAAAVADRMVSLGLASQTAASTTRPAAYCGIAGLVATPGRYDTSGVTGLSPTLDSLGFLTRDVDDLALVAEALLGVPRATDLATAPALLVSSGEVFGEVSLPMQEALRRTAVACADSGARLGTLSTTAGLASLPDLQATVMAYEAARSLAREAGTGQLSDALMRLLDQGRATPVSEYERARDAAAHQSAALLEALDGFDTVLTVAAPGTAPEGMPTGNPAFSRPWQVLGFPSVAIPGNVDAEGMPLGVQVVGRPGDEGHLIAVASWVARIIGPAVCPAGH